ncbi:MAG: hypothetical protein AAGF12_35190, partial [Myxococcota bacterium]
HAEGQSTAETQRRIDFWWRSGAGNLSFAVSLVRFLSQSVAYADAQMRFVLYAEEGVSGDYLRSETHRVLDESRVNAQVKVVRGAQDGSDFGERLRAESETAALVVLSLDDDAAFDDRSVAELGKLSTHLHEALFCRAASVFEPVLKAVRTQQTTELSLAEDGDAEGDELPPIHVSETVAIAEAARTLSGRHDEFGEKLADQGIGPLYERNQRLLEDIRNLLDKHLLSLQKRLGDANPQKQINITNRVQSAFLLDAEKLLREFRDTALAEQRGILEGRIEAFFEADWRDKTTLRVVRPREDFAVKEHDERDVARVKKQRRRSALLHRGKEIHYSLRLDDLRRYYRATFAIEVLHAPLRAFATDSHQLMLTVGKLVNASKTSLALLGDQYTGDEERREFLDEQRRRSSEEIDGLMAQQGIRAKRQRRIIRQTARRVSQRYALDLDRIDLHPFVRRERRIPEEARGTFIELKEMPQHWFESQQLLLGRAELGLTVSTFQHRLATVSQRLRDLIGSELQGGITSELIALKDSLHAWLADESASPKKIKSHLEVKKRFDPKPLTERIIRETGTLTAGLPEALATLADESIRALALGQGSEIETRKVSVRGVAEFLLETEFISNLQRDLERVVPIEDHAVGVAQDIVRLLSFNVTEAEELSPEEARAHLTPVVESAIERMDNELQELRELGPKLEELIDDRLQVVIEGTDAYEITRMSDNLTRQFRKVESQKAISGLRGYVDQGAAALRRAMVYLLYQRSAGVLYAKKLRARSQRSTSTDALLSLVERARPEPAVVEALPFFYRQLFLGQSAINKSFWVERAEELRLAKAAVLRHSGGGHGALFITGERLSGKTALLHRIIGAFLSKRSVVWLHPPPGGSARVADFDEALRSASRGDGSRDEIFSDLKDGSVVVIDDLELWWERSSEGFDVLDAIFEAVGAHGSRLLFLIGIGNHAFPLIDRLRPLSDNALSIVDCGPMSAESISEVVTLRHGSAGMKFELDDRDEQDLSPWMLARLFSKHFDYAGGYVGAALRGWIANIQAVHDKSLVIDVPDRGDLGALDELRLDWTALLVQVALHKQRDRDALSRVSGIDRATIDRDTESLARLGLLSVDRDGVVEIDPFVHHLVTERFSRRGLLS